MDGDPSVGGQLRWPNAHHGDDFPYIVVMGKTYEDGSHPRWRSGGLFSGKWKLYPHMRRDVVISSKPCQVIRGEPAPGAAEILSHLLWLSRAPKGENRGPNNGRGSGTSDTQRKCINSGALTISHRGFRGRGRSLPCMAGISLAFRVQSD
ncbi:hypothetical protein LIER_33916 [Lithospermum erythrorhizon]|uniref:Uncharacterized protein n=1 Tax=Lithospermum erythrorhizon TaxID=34254 RepID=A0AAV3RY07_LITER